MTAKKTSNEEKSKRGFAAMDRETHRRIASSGGVAAHAMGKAHEFTPEEARKAGKKGGNTVSRDRAHMAEIGRVGGARSGASKKAAKEKGAAAE